MMEIIPATFRDGRNGKKKLIIQNVILIIEVMILKHLVKNRNHFTPFKNNLNESSVFEDAGEAERNSTPRVGSVSQCSIRAVRPRPRPERWR